jgi:hypothetical protein
LASYETSAKDFLYPHSSERTHYTGGRRHILLSRTIDLSGVSPTLEFMVSLAIDDVTGIISAAKPRRQTKPITSYGKNVNILLKYNSFYFVVLAKTITITSMDTIIDISESVIFRFR